MSHISGAFEPDHKMSHEWKDRDGSVVDGAITADPNTVALAASYKPDTPEEKALIWKIDKRIVVSQHSLVHPRRITDVLALHLGSLYPILSGSCEHW